MCWLGCLGCSGCLRCLWLACLWRTRVDRRGELCFDCFACFDSCSLPASPTSPPRLPMECVQCGDGRTFQCSTFSSEIGRRAREASRTMAKRRWANEEHAVGRSACLLSVLCHCSKILRKTKHCKSREVACSHGESGESVEPTLCGCAPRTITYCKKQLQLLVKLHCYSTNLLPWGDLSLPSHQN